MGGSIYIIVTLLAAVLLIGGGLWSVRKSTENRSVLFDRFAIKNLNMIFLAITAGLFMAEAAVAMLLHPEGEKYSYDHSARYMQHMLMALAGLACSYGTLHFMEEVLLNIRFLFFSEKFTYKQKSYTLNPSFGFIIQWVLTAILFGLCVFGTVLIPYWGSSLIAQGVDKAKEFDFVLMRDIFIFSWQYTEQDLIRFATKHHIDYTSDAAALLGFGGNICLKMMLAHYVCIVIKAFLTLKNTADAAHNFGLDKYRRKQKMILIGLIKVDEFEVEKPTDKTKKKEEKPVSKKEEKLEEEASEKSEPEEEEDNDDDKAEGSSDQIASIENVLEYFERANKLKKSIKETREYFLGKREDSSSSSESTETMTAIVNLFSFYNDIVSDATDFVIQTYNQFKSDMTKPILQDGAGLNESEFNQYFK